MTTATARSRAHADPGRSRRIDDPSPWFAAPALVLFGLFALLPMAIVAVLSFTTWDGLSAPEFAGFDNWVKLVTEPSIGNSVWVTGQVMVLSWLIQTPVSLLLGVYVAGRQRYRAALATVFFLPLVLSSAGIAILWKVMVDPNFGLVPSLGLGNPNLLGNVDLALYVVIAVVAWQFIPFHTLLYQAGARQIPRQLYEAAEIDGAGPVRCFFTITLPQLRNTVVTSSTLVLVGSLTYFDLFYVITQGGPGDATRILPLQMYVVGFEHHQLGYASAIAVLLVAAGVSLSVALTKYSGFGTMRSDREGL